MFSCEFCEISKNIFFTEHLPDDCFSLFECFQIRWKVEKTQIIETFTKITSKTARENVKKNWEFTEKSISSFVKHDPTHILDKVEKSYMNLYRLLSTEILKKL